MKKLNLNMHDDEIIPFLTDDEWLKFESFLQDMFTDMFGFGTHSKLLYEKELIKRII